MTAMTIKILETDGEIRRLIRKALVIEINRNLTPTSIKNLISAIRPKIMLMLRDAPEARSILFGDLAGQLGVPSGLEADFVYQICLTIANNIKVDYYPVKLTGSTITGGFIFYVAKDDFSDILALPQATISTSKGQTLPWLEWLLLEGSKVIIAEHKLEFAPSHSRSHSYIMVKDAGSAWAIPSSFAGTLKDNWITRALDDNLKVIQVIIATELKRIF